MAESLPIDSISTAELSRVLKGDFTNWSSLSSKNLPINIYGRQSNSGTHDFVQKKPGINFSPYAKEMNGNAQILEAIKADNSGIGYVGAGYVIHGGSKGIKVLPIYSKIYLPQLFWLHYFRKCIWKSRGCNLGYIAKAVYFSA